MFYPWIRRTTGVQYCDDNNSICLQGEKKSGYSCREMVEETSQLAMAYKTYRSINDHIQPFLALNGVLLHIGSQKEGSYICTLTKLDELSKISSETTNLSVKREVLRNLLDSLKE